MTEYRGLPKEYKQVEYIESVSKQHINTAFNPTSHTKVVIDVELISQSSGSHACIFGSRNAASSTATQSFCVWSMSPGTTIRSDYFGGNKSISHSIIGKRVTITKDGRHCEVDNKVIYNDEKTGSSSYPLCLMGCNTAGVWEYRSPMRLYSCQIYDIGRLQRDYVPAKRTSDGAIGVYDMVSKKFFTNAGSGSFTAGAEVKKPVAAYIGVLDDTPIVINAVNFDNYFEYIDTRHSDTGNPLNYPEFKPNSNGISSFNDSLDESTNVSHKFIVEWIAKQDCKITFEQSVSGSLSYSYFINGIDNSDNTLNPYTKELKRGESITFTMSVGSNLVRVRVAEITVTISNIVVIPQTSVARKITNAYIGAPETVKLDGSNLLSYFETDQLNDFDGTQFRLIRYDVLDAGGLQSVELIAKEDTVISFDYSFYRELSDRIFELYINSELIYSFSNTEYTYKNKWSGRVSKNSSLKIELKLNTDITGEVSVRAPSYVDCVISNIQISTPSMPSVARKITKAYIGVPTQIPIYEEQQVTKDVETLITPSNISNFFTVLDNAYKFVGDSSGKFTSNNKGYNSTTAKSSWIAKKQIKKLTFNYKVSSESGYDKYTITVGGSTVASDISGSGSDKSYSGSLDSGKAIVLRYSKDSSQHKNDDCGTIWNIKVTTTENVTEKVQVGTETKEVARLCYQAPPSEIVITKDNVAQYFKVNNTANPGTNSSVYKWKNEKYGLYEMASDAEGYAIAYWEVLEPSKYSISFDAYTYTGMATISILDGPNKPIQELELDVIGMDPPDSETHYGSISNTVLNSAIQFNNNAYGMPSLEHTYLEISNIRLKPIS